MGKRKVIDRRKGSVTVAGYGEIKTVWGTVFSPRAQMTEKLIEKLAICTGEPDGEDSSGRQKFKLISPKDVVHRACEIADAMMTEVEQRGWTIQLPLNDEDLGVTPERED